MILDGKKIKKQILDELQEEVSQLVIKPKLVVIQVGNNEASNVYIKQKSNMCNYIGYDFEHVKLENNVTTNMVIELINKFNNDTRITGILVQLPLPKHLDSNKIINSISPDKDVDGLTDINIGKLCHKKDTLYSCTPYGIMELFDRYNIELSGKNVVVIGRSDLVGKPMSIMMLNKDATVTICHSKTKELLEHTKKSDILIVAIGKPNYITKEMISENSVVIDVGISKTETGICGDVDFENIKDKVRYITPVPGGVGPMTVAMLGKNILKAYKLQSKLRN